MSITRSVLRFNGKLVQAAPSSRARRRIAVVALYVGLALWTTWPLARFPATTLPMGTAQVATVPLFNLWTIWWNADRLLHGLNGYWDAPIFHPARDTFAFSEPQPTTILVAPLVWLTGSRVLAYNVYLWLSLVLNGVFARRLLRVLGVGRVTAVGGGAAMLLLPIVHWQLDVLQLVPLWGILWTWMAFVKAFRIRLAGGELAARLLGRLARRGVWRGGELGAAFGVTFLTCGHHGLFLAVLIAGAAWTLRERLLRRRTWFVWFSAAVVATVLAGPIAARLQHVARKNDFTRSRETVSQLSAMPGDYTASSGRQLIDLGNVAARPNWRLSPGWIKVGLAVLGMAFGLSRRRWRQWTAFLLVTAVLAFLLSLGPNLRIREWQPWWTLTQVCPGFSQVRNVFRFAFFVQMAAVLFASQGLHALSAMSRRFVAAKLWRYVTGTVLSVLGLAAILETRPEPPKLATAPDAVAHSGWIEFVRDETPPGHAIACLPFAGGNQMGDFDVTTRWMYFGTFHRARMVNGYSGFFPRDYFEIRDAVNTSFPTEAILRRLADADVEFLVVMRSLISAESLGSATFDSVFLERVFDDSVGVDVYRLRRTE